METPASEPHNEETTATEKHAPTKKSFGFFAIIAALALTGLLTSLEATITSTALPPIVADVGGGELYFWVANGYYLTQYVLLAAVTATPLL